MAQPDWARLYRGAVDRFLGRISSSGGLAVAFNTNIDGIINLTTQRLEAVLRSDAKASDDAFCRRANPPGRIDAPADFLAGLMHFMERGAGGEYMIYDQSAYDWIVSRLPIDAFRMGGNAGIMTNALSILGARFVIPHAVQLPERQARLFLDRKNILLPVIRNGKVEFDLPSTASRPDRELVHLILEFKEGTSFHWAGRRIVAPRNNRFIANADDYNGRIVVDPAFVRGVKKRLGGIDKCILTGLHMLKSSYPDGATYIDRLEEVLGLVRRWRRGQPEMKVHFEMADVQDTAIRRDILRMACEVSDSIGMNEDELRAAMGSPIEPSDPAGMAGAMTDFASSYGLGKVLVHSRDFVVSAVMGEYGVEPEVVSDAQMLGVLCSQNRAYTGDFGDPAALRGLVESDALQPSAIGLESYHRFRSLGTERGPGIWNLGREGWIVLTPCLLSKTTLNTVGLGDCLTAGVVIGEIQDRKGRPRISQ